MKNSKDITKVNLADNKHIHIDATKRLPKLDLGGLHAYEAKKAVLGETTKCFALICDRALMPRYEHIESYMPLLNCGLRQLVEYGIAYWPPAKQERLIFVYEHSANVPLAAEESNDIALAIKPAVVKEKIIPFFLQLLQKLETVSLTHGALCLSNVFSYGDAGQYTNMVAGDMLALPFGYTQPKIYKTIPAMMASHIGRGEGNISDDIYAFGVCLALMMRSKPPFQGKSDEEVLQLKMKNGSYAALLDQERFGTAFFELLRGVLHDDPKKRWTVEEILLWAEGRTLTPKQFVRDKPAPRPLEFNGEQYEQVSFLAKDLPLNPPEVAALVENGKIMHWLERSVAKKSLFERAQKALSYIRGSVKAADKPDATVAMLSNAMAIRNPLMYKELRFFPNAICNLMINRVVNGGDLNPILETLRYGIIPSWCAFQIDENPDLSSEVNAIERCLVELRNSRIGHGAERCLYILSSHVPCLSPVFENHYVSSTKKLVTVIDELVGQKKIKFADLMDRHIAAFIIQHKPKMIEKTIFDLHAEKDSDYLLALLKIYAQGQKIHKIKKLTHLAALFEKKIGPCYDIYHDKSLREDLKKQAKDTAKSGDLVKMVDLFTDIKRLRRDRYNYLAANQEYINLEAERAHVTEMLSDKKKFTASMSHRLPVIASALVAIGMIIFALIGGK